jgi:hypothetical protein
VRLEACGDVWGRHACLASLAMIVAIERDADDSFTAYKVLNEICAGV